MMHRTSDAVLAGGVRRSGDDLRLQPDGHRGWRHNGNWFVENPQRPFEQLGHAHP
jgi:hypothetical protein